jgi:SWI/SNF-related matrix-associated actin-dependent regulator of chromatin subfamily A member 5
MKPYQLSGLSFLVYMFKNGVPCLLGDEMGLGKTLQSLALFQYVKENVKTSGGEHRPSLVVCPLSVLSSWMSEAKRWTPGLKVLRFHGPVGERARLKSIADGTMTMYGQETRQAKKKRNIRRTAAGKDIISLDTSDEEEEDSNGYDIIVTSYETFTSEQGWFKRAFVWRYVVLDEGHKIKNELSNVSKALHGLSAEHALLLSGTPLQNNLGELWALLHWLYPEVFTERTGELFKEAFNLTRGKVSTPILDNSRKLLELIMLRRMKHSPGVDLNLPPKTDVLLFVPLTPMQRFWYQRLLTRADRGLLEDLFKGAKDKAEADRRKLDVEEAKLKLEELEKVAAVDESVTKTDTWAESRAIMQRAIEADAKEEKGKGAWNKLMNLLMQLRKVCWVCYLWSIC